MLVAAQRVDRGERCEDRVAVVGAAAAVQLVALDHRRPRAEALAPAGHLGLLVEVAVEHHGVARACRRCPGMSMKITGVRSPSRTTSSARLGGRAALAPSRRAARRRGPCGRSSPVGIEHRRLVRDLDVVDQRRDDRTSRTRSSTQLAVLSLTCITPVYHCRSGRGRGGPTTRSPFITPLSNAAFSSAALFWRARASSASAFSLAVSAALLS